MSAKKTSKEAIFGEVKAAKPLAVSENTTLRPCDELVEATAPATGTLALVLPPAGLATDCRFLVRVVAQAAEYTDGNVTLATAGDDCHTVTLTTDELATVGDYLYVENVKGQFYRKIAGAVA